MNIDLLKLISPNSTIAVALSGGSDSMALLHYMLSKADKFQLNIIALNVEHGIRGEQSLSDTKFCIDYCAKIGVPILTYSVDAPALSKAEKLSLEEAGRKLRYECFFDALKQKKCDMIATAHHLDDNLESILFNLFRGTGVQGATGIAKNYQNKIIRPFLNLNKSEIDEYVKAHAIPFVTDKTNFSTDYTRNALRINVIPKIKELFPKASASLLRFAEILQSENDYLEEISQKNLNSTNGRVEIFIPVHPAIFSRATIKALKILGLEKDYEKIHVDQAYSLVDKPNGTSIDLPQGVCAIREYDKIVFFKKQAVKNFVIPFSIGKHELGSETVTVNQLKTLPKDLKRGLFADKDKIPSSAVIRRKTDGDVFTKFGGGTKSLGDYLTDLKIPKRERENLVVLAVDNQVLAIFNLAVSDKIKIDKNTKTALQFI